MLRRAGERLQFVAAERDKDAAAFLPDGAHRRFGVVRLDPAIARDGGPRRPAQRHERHGGLARGGNRVFRNDRRIGMGGVDQGVDVLGDEIIGQARGAAKPADANRHGVWNRRGRAAGERQRHVETAALGEPFAQRARFRCAAENKDAGHVSF